MKGRFYCNSRSVVQCRHARVPGVFRSRDMDVSTVRRPRNDKGRTRRFAITAATLAATIGIVTPVLAQSIDSKPTRAASREDSPKRARTERADRTESLRDVERDYARDAEATAL